MRHHVGFEQHERKKELLFYYLRTGFLLAVRPVIQCFKMQNDFILCCFPALRGYFYDVRPCQDVKMFLFFFLNTALKFIPSLVDKTANCVFAGVRLTTAVCRKTSLLVASALICSRCFLNY